MLDIKEKIMLLLTVAFGIFMLIEERILGFIFCSVFFFFYWAMHDFGYKPHAENEMDQEEGR